MKLINILLLSLLSLNHLSAQESQPKLAIEKLTGDCYVYTTCNTYKGILFPANSMYLVTDKGVVMFDTPWDTTQFQPLLDSIKARHNKEVVMCIATHSHADRTAGLEFLKGKGISTYTTTYTDKRSAATNEKRAEFLIDKDTVFTVGQHTFETFYPGKGHAPDNIVIWLGEQKILYGGCFIKSTEATDLGNLADANVKEWEGSIRKVKQRYSQPAFVIAGHQDWHSNKSLDHTLKLVKKYKKKH